MNVSEQIVVRRTRSKVHEVDCARNDMGERQTLTSRYVPKVLGFTSIEKKTPDHRPFGRIGLVCRRVHRDASSSMDEKDNFRSFLLGRKRK